MAKVGDKERDGIVALLHEHNGNRNRVARLCGRSPSTVQKIAESEGIASNIRTPKKANDARRGYAKDERLGLLNAGFEKAQTILDTLVVRPGDLKEWSVAVGTLIDKRRLEDGEATSRTENVDPARRQRFKKHLDELAERRRSHPG